MSEGGQYGGRKKIRIKKEIEARNEREIRQSRKKI
jgi:hypothetical protein